MVRFKVADRVRSLYDLALGPKGMEVTVTSVDPVPSPHFTYTLDNYAVPWIGTMSDFELVTSQQQLTLIPKPKFKVGDKVRALIDSPRCCHFIKKDTEVEVYCIDDPVYSAGDFEYYWVNSSEMRYKFMGYEHEFELIHLGQIALPHLSSLIGAWHPSGAHKTSVPFSDPYAVLSTFPTVTAPINICDCGGHAAQTTHAFWCSTHNKGDKS